MSGMLELLCGPSGVGKSTSIRKSKAYTYTTRDQRPNEVNGVDRNFVSEREFDDLLSQGRVVAPYEALDHRYGFSAELKDALQNGEKVFEQIGPYEAIKAVEKEFSQYGEVRKILFLAFPGSIISNLLGRSGPEDEQVLKRADYSDDMLLRYLPHLDEFFNVYFNYSCIGKMEHEDFHPELLMGRIDHLVDRIEKIMSGEPRLIELADVITKIKDFRDDLGELGKYNLPIHLAKHLYNAVLYDLKLLANADLNDGLVESRDLELDILRKSLYLDPQLMNIFNIMQRIEASGEILRVLEGEEIFTNRKYFNVSGWGGETLPPEIVGPFLPFFVTKISADLDRKDLAQEYLLKSAVEYTLLFDDRVGFQPALVDFINRMPYLKKMSENMNDSPEDFARMLKFSIGSTENTVLAACIGKSLLYDSGNFSPALEKRLRESLYYRKMKALFTFYRNHSENFEEILTFAVSETFSDFLANVELN